MKRLTVFVLLACCLSASAQTKFTPNVVVLTNEFKEKETRIVWTNLPARYGGSLGTEMVFRSVVLKRVTFMEQDSRTLKAFDVTDLHQDVLDYHRIDADAQLRKSQTADEAWANKERRDLNIWKQTEDARQIRLAQEAAARAEAERLAAIEYEKAFQRDLELRKVQAEEVKANAEEIKALNPAPGVIIQNQNLNRVGPYFR